LFKADAVLQLQSIFRVSGTVSGHFSLCWSWCPVMCWKVTVIGVNDANINCIAWTVGCSLQVVLFG